MSRVECTAPPGALAMKTAAGVSATTSRSVPGARSTTVAEGPSKMSSRLPTLPKDWSPARTDTAPCCTVTATSRSSDGREKP